jgi:hypothetical protein
MKNLLVLGILSVLSSCNSCASHVLSEECKGIVTEKYIDHNNHGLRTIVVVNPPEKKFITTIGYDTIALYTNVRVGDSIIKKKGEMLYIIKGVGKEILYDSKCWQ